MTIIRLKKNILKHIEHKNSDKKINISKSNIFWLTFFTSSSQLIWYVNTLNIMHWSIFPAAIPMKKPVIY